MTAQPWQFIDQRVHGALDLLVDATLMGIALTAWHAGGSTPAIVLPFVIGCANLSYSALTRYALGRRHVFSFSTHLVLDAFAGALLVLGSLLLKNDGALYRGIVLVLGLGIIMAVLLTNPLVPETKG